MTASGAHVDGIATSERTAHFEMIAFECDVHH
jgi:hypothetical protein